MFCQPIVTSFSISYISKEKQINLEKKNSFAHISIELSNNELREWKLVQNSRQDLFYKHEVDIAEDIFYGKLDICDGKGALGVLCDCYVSLELKCKYYIDKGIRCIVSLTD